MGGKWPSSEVPFQFSKDSLWLELQAYKIIEQNSVVASSKGINKTIIGDPFLFLVPSTFSTTMNHSYENATAIGSKSAEYLAGLSKLGKEINGLGSVVTNKYDTPITFTDSERRMLNITVGLQDQGDTYSDVFIPVRTLESYSCPDKTFGNFNFDMPYIFTVKTIDSDLIFMENAALTSIQPTWYGPYRGNYPSKCELTLEFKDIEPLYRHVLDKNAKVTGKQKEAYGANMAVK